MPRRRADPDSAAAQTVQRLLNETKPGLDAHGTRCSRYDRAYEVWRAPDNEKERQGRPAWKPLLKVKYAMQSVDQATVAVAQGIPGVRCTPRNPQSVEKAKAMEQLLTYYADIGHLAEKVPIIVQQALIFGPSPAKTSWLYREADRPALRAEYGYQPGTRRIIEADRPDMQPLDVYDVWWDPAAADVDSAAYVVCRYWPTKEELERHRYDEDSGYGQYRNLDLLYQAGAGAERPQTQQNAILDDALTSYRGRFEIWEVWRDDRLTVIGNRQILLYDGEKPYWMPGKPVTISQARPDLFRIEGISETEMLDHIQQNLHAQDNLRLENQRFSVNRGATVRSTVPDMKALVVQPHFLWEVMDHDDVHFIDQPPLPPEAYREHEVLLSLMQLATGVNAYVTGASGAGTGVDQTTATGISLLSNSASRLLVFKANLIGQRTWQRTFEQWGDLTRQFLRSEVDVAVRGPGEQIDWRSTGPQDVDGDFDIRIESAEESLTRQQRRADAVALLNALAPYAQAGIIDPKPLLRQVAESFGFPSPEALFPAAQPQPQAAPSLLSLNGGQQGQQYPTGPTPNTLGGQLAPHPAMSILAGNAR